MSLLLALALTWIAQPPRVARLLLGQAGAALGLEITASGVTEYTLAGRPTLVVRDLVARQPGADTPVLEAGRVYLSLPWSTLRSRGADLTVEHVELDAPRLDLAALQRWRQSRPPSGEVRVPSLTAGLEISRGVIIGDGWSVDRVAVRLPTLHPDRPVAGRVGGRFRNGDTSVPFDLQVVLTAPSADAALGAAGIATVVTPHWRLSMRTTVSGRLHDSGEALGLDGFRLGAAARHIADGREIPFVLGLAGPARYHDGRLSIAPLGVALRGRDQGPVPDLGGHGRFAFDGGLSLGLEGSLAAWPETWPSLPPPLDRPVVPLPFALDYAGPANLSGPARLNLQRDDTALDVRFHLPDVLAWIDRIDAGTPLPPLDGTFSTPRLEMAGATLDGVEIEFSEDPADD